MRVAITGVGAVGGWGRGWHGLSALDRVPPAVADLPPPLDRTDAFARRIVSRPAIFAAIALSDALAEAGWAAPFPDVGLWLGVGASGGPLTQMEALLRRALDAGALSLPALGRVGLRAVNPLFAFQLMNNFTLCHPAILHGIRGPNAALLSRGAGTVIALDEARRAILDGECTRALAGGADSALHPVTAAELRDHPAPLAEGAAILALGAGTPLAWLEGCHYGRARPAPDPDDLDLRPLGEALAASPAIGCAVAIDLFRRGSRDRARIVTSGLDGQFGVVHLRAA